MKTRLDSKIAGRGLGHVPALDGIRALAALAVVGFHARIVGFGDGEIGVDVFFVLSGFLITSILLVRSGPTTRLDYRDFYRRRALRLLPAYFAVVACCVSVDLVEHIGGTLKGAAASLIYMANWLSVVSPQGLGLLIHTWSLSVEEQFYLIWPAVLAFILTRFQWSAKRAMNAVVALLLASWLLAVALAVIGASPWIAERATPTRAFDLLAGALLAIFVATPRRSGALTPVRSTSSVSVAAAVAGVLLISLVAVSGITADVRSILGWPLISLLTCIVIYGCLRAAPLVTSLLASRPMSAIGKRSYGVYLWHFPIFFVIDSRWGLHGWQPRVVGLAATAVAVSLSYRFIEQPFLARKDRRLLRPAAALELEEHSARVAA